MESSAQYGDEGAMLPLLACDRLLLAALRAVWTDAELCGEAPDQRRPVLVMFAEPFVETPDMVVDIERPQHEAVGVIARRREQRRMDRAVLAGLGRPQTDGKRGRASQRQEPGDKGLVGARYEKIERPVRQNDVQADCAGIRAGERRKRAPELPVPQRHRLGNRSQRRFVDAHDHDAVGRRLRCQRPIDSELGIKDLEVDPAGCDEQRDDSKRRRKRNAVGTMSGHGQTVGDVHMTVPLATLHERRGGHIPLTMPGGRTARRTYVKLAIVRAIDRTEGAGREYALDACSNLHETVRTGPHKIRVCTRGL